MLPKTENFIQNLVKERETVTCRLSSIKSFNLKRNDLNIQFNEDILNHYLKNCHNKINRINIDFKELYDEIKENNNDRTKNNLQSFINEELYSEILNHITNVQMYLNNDLNEQRKEIQKSFEDKVVEYEENAKEDLKRQLLEKKNKILSIHKVIYELDELLDTYSYMKKKLNKCLEEKKVYENEIKIQLQYQKKLEESIKYHLVSMREKIQKKNILLSPIKDKNKTTKKNFNSLLYTTNDNENSSLKSIQGEFMKKQIKYYCNKTLFLTREHGKMIGRNFSCIKNENDQKVSDKRQANLLYNKIIDCIERSRILFHDKNKQFDIIFNQRKHNLELSIWKLIEDTGFRYIFIEEIMKDEYINDSLDNQKNETIATSNFLLFNKFSQNLNKKKYFY